MTTIVTRAGKGTTLSWAEMDANLNNLNDNKLEASAIANMLEIDDIGVTVQPYDATILVDDDIGISVEPYDATILKDADIGVTIQAYDATIVVDADIGVSVQPYDADTAKTDVAQNFTLPQRSSLLTDNDGSFDLSAKQNFKCTTAGAVTLTFTNQVDGLSGSVIFINASNHTVSAHANTKLTSSDLAKLSVSGTYRIDYLTDGTDAYCSVVGSYS